MWTHFVAVLILIRHGQTTSNAQGLLVGRSDPDLTERGREQALALRHYLRDIEHVVSSPLSRALETAELAVPHITPIVDEAFIEVDYGTLEGHALTEVPLEQWRSFEEDHTLALGGGESLAALDERVHLRLNQWMADPDNLLHHPSQHIVVASHVSPIKSALAWALGVSGGVAWRSRLDNGSVTTITSRRGAPLLVTFNVVPPSHHGG
jgi:probable phosphoglycerate mutase